MRPEHALAILVIDSPRRYSNKRIERQAGEPPEQYADRVRAALIELLTKPNT